MLQNPPPPKYWWWLVNSNQNWMTIYSRRQNAANFKYEEIETVTSSLVNISWVERCQWCSERFDSVFQELCISILYLAVTYSFPIAEVDQMFLRQRPKSHSSISTGVIIGQLSAGRFPLISLLPMWLKLQWRQVNGLLSDGEWLTLQCWLCVCSLARQEKNLTIPIYWMFQLSDVYKGYLCYWFFFSGQHIKPLCLQ